MLIGPNSKRFVTQSVRSLNVKLVSQLEINFEFLETNEIIFVKKVFDQRS